jgi:hypothetical protein
MKKYAYILLLFIGFASCKASATTYYVATNGNDNNAGSKDDKQTYKIAKKLVIQK